MLHDVLGQRVGLQLSKFVGCHLGFLIYPLMKYSVNIDTK